MSTLTIRNLDDAVKTELRKRAAERGVSMEQEARDVLTREVALGPRKKPSLDAIMRLSRKPKEPFDSGHAQQEVWNYLYEDRSK